MTIYIPQLADVKWGVIGISWREVPCDHVPARTAQLPPGRSPSPSKVSPPYGWSSDKDKRVTGDTYWNTAVRIIAAWSDT